DELVGEAAGEAAGGSSAEAVGRNGGGNGGGIRRENYGSTVAWLCAVPHRVAAAVWSGARRTAHTLRPAPCWARAAPQPSATCSTSISPRPHSSSGLAVCTSTSSADRPWSVTSRYSSPEEDQRETSIQSLAECRTALVNNSLTTSVISSQHGSAPQA